MKTERLYYLDNHMKEFTAGVISCEKTAEGRYEAVLDRTAFFPEGGGQPADTGTLGGAKVVDTKERGDVIVHVLEGSPLSAGDKVSGKIDWERRFDIMQQHSGEHMVSGVIHSNYGYDNVGFHIGADYVTLDMNGALEDSQLRAIEDKVNAAIWNDLPVITEIPSADKLAEMEYRSKKELSGEVRIVTIPGIDVCACCGVHVSTAGEIGAVKIVDSKKYKSGVRLTIRCGKRALLDHREKQNSVAEISRLLSAKPEETAQAVEKLQKSFENAKYQLGVQEERLVKYAAAHVEAQAERVCVIADGISPEGVWKYASALAERYVCAAVFSCNNGAFSYAAASAKEDVGELCKSLNKALSGRGGGRDGIVRGSVLASEEEITAYFESLNGSWHTVLG